MNELIMWSPGITLEQIEKQVILKAFRFHRGNKTITAQALGISIRNLDGKLEKYQAEEDEQEKQNALRAAERENFLARSRGNVALNPQTGTDFLSADEGFRLEPATSDSPEQTMPVPKRREVQTVLPGQASKSSTGKNR